MTKSPAPRGRRIKTVEDAIAVLESPRASFTELTDCIAVCREHDELEIRHRCAERALVEAFRPNASQVRIPQVEKAAEEVRAAHLSGLEELDDLRSAADMIRLQADRLVAEVDLHHPGREANELPDLLTLSEMVILLDDGEPRSLITLSSRLRGEGSPTMAKEASGRALHLDPGNHPALTTRAAACADLAEFPEATHLIESVISEAPDNTHALNVLSRVFQETGRNKEAYETATRAIELNPNKYTAHRLMSAAAALGDHQAFDSAHSIARARADTDPRDPWVTILAAKILIEHDRLEEVEILIHELERTTMDSNSRKRLQRVKRSLREAWSRRQGGLDL